MVAVASVHPVRSHEWPVLLQRALGAGVSARPATTGSTSPPMEDLNVDAEVRWSRTADGTGPVGFPPVAAGVGPEVSDFRWH
jgi:hypothetical protein